MRYKLVVGSVALSSVIVPTQGGNKSWLGHLWLGSLMMKMTELQFCVFLDHHTIILLGGLQGEVGKDTGQWT